MPTPPVVVKAWQQKRAEPFKSRHQSVAISAFPIINLCQLCLAECVGFSRGMTAFVSHPQKTAQICQIKLDEKRDSRQKALGLFCIDMSGCYAWRKSLLILGYGCKWMRDSSRRVGIPAALKRCIIQEVQIDGRQ